MGRQAIRQERASGTDRIDAHSVDEASEGLVAIDEDIPF